MNATAIKPTKYLVWYRYKKKPSNAWVIAKIELNTISVDLPNLAMWLMENKHQCQQLLLTAISAVDE